jgi:hypothetical protein
MCQGSDTGQTIFSVSLDQQIQILENYGTEVNFLQMILRYMPKCLRINLGEKLPNWARCVHRTDHHARSKHNLVLSMENSL